VIAYVACVGSPEVYAARAAPGLRRVAEADSLFAEVETADSIFAAYNEALEHFATVEGLEALVLLHEDVELLDPRFGARLREALRDPSVAVVGAVGARGVTSLAWWEGELAGRALETRGTVEGGFADVEVDAVDGLLLALSPWAVRHLRFDAETFTGFHGYDVDLCLSARAAGRRVVVADLLLMHHTKGGYGDRAAWDAADAALRAKWGLSGGGSGPGPSAGPPAAPDRGAPGPTGSLTAA
jgi:GT2 family glycosyltransferase